MKTNKKNEIDREIIISSSYCNIIKQIVCSHSGISINKLLVFAYIVKKNRFYEFDIYSGRDGNDLVFKAISQISGSFDDYCESVQFIVFAIHLLAINNVISFHAGHLFWPDAKAKVTIGFSRFIDKTLDESGPLSDRQFLKEVISNV